MRGWKNGEENPKLEGHRYSIPVRLQVCLSLNSSSLLAPEAAHSLCLWRGLNFGKISVLLSHHLSLSSFHNGLLLLLFSRSVVSDSLRPHGLQHARPPCPSPSPGACSNSCPSRRWCHPTISSSVVPFSSCLQSFPASRSIPISQFFASGGQGLELQHQSMQWIFRTDVL